MYRDLRRVSFIAVLLLVALRVAIGWQFLYEGLWKYRTQSTATPWSAKGYLRNAVGPMRETYRSMTGDPDDLNWLDYDTMTARWDAWKDRFIAHYELTDEQQADLQAILSGNESYEVPLASKPEKATFNGSLGVRIKFFPPKEPGKKGKLVVPQGQTWEEAHYRRLKSFVTKAEASEYHKAIDRLYNMVSSQPYKERLKILLLDDAEWAGVIKDSEGKVLEQRSGKFDLYREWLKNYERELASASQDFEFDHLRTDWSEIQELRKELVTPIQTLEANLKAEADNLLTEEQVSASPLPPESTMLRTVDQLTIYALIVLGVLLIAGFLTRVAALAGAVMVLSFYMAAPPWPGVPPALGPEHSFFVNKNLIEVVALLALVFLPSGSWFGVDGFFRRIFGRN